MAVELVLAAIGHKVHFSVLLFDGWYLSEQLVEVARRRRKDWISILKKNRNLETNSLKLSGLPSIITDKKQLADQNHWRGLSSASASIN